MLPTRARVNGAKKSPSSSARKFSQQFKEPLDRRIGIRSTHGSPKEPVSIVQVLGAVQLQETVLFAREWFELHFIQGSLKRCRSTFHD